MKILVTHAYSADNAGDGLLVHKTLELLKQAFGESIDITLLAVRPETFHELDATVISTVPTLKGWNRQFRECLKQIDTFDLVVAVGGGYLRAGTLQEAVKTALVHGPQLFAASRTTAPTIYLPQSVGPIRFGLRRSVEYLFRRLDLLMLRDDRSLSEFPGANITRASDLATAGIEPPTARVLASDVPVLSVRAIRGEVPENLYSLAEELGEYDVYVQSTSGGNDDRPATRTFRGRREVSRSELLSAKAVDSPRVVIAVRLHAALMALKAGHFVIHLAYERKGFGAFDDLGLSDFVHNVNSFQPDNVLKQVRELTHSAKYRSEYAAKLLATQTIRRSTNAKVIDAMVGLHEGHA